MCTSAQSGKNYPSFLGNQGPYIIVDASAKATSSKAADEHITGIKGFGSFIIVNTELAIWFEGTAKWSPRLLASGELHPVRLTPA
jgi:hypothetical protein